MSTVPLLRMISAMSRRRSGPSVAVVGFCSVGTRIDRLGFVFLASGPQRIRQNALLVHCHTDETHTQLFGSSLHSGERQGLCRHQISR